MAFCVHLLEPVGIAGHIARGHRVLAGKRRVPNDRVEARILPLEHLRELDLPVKGRKRRIGVLPSFEPTAVALGLAAHDRVGILAALCFPLPGLGALEEGRNHEVPKESHLRKLGLRLIPQVVPVPVGDALVGLTNAPAQQCRRSSPG